jgi:acetyl-CoA carboxylase biotin carboxyl carrier protein
VKFKNVDLDELIRLMKEHDLTEIVLKEGKTTVEIKRNRGADWVNREEISSRRSEHIPAAEAVKKEINAAASIDTGNGSSVLLGAPDDESYHIIEAPLVGTFFRAAAPDAKPFVEVGDKVDDGDVLCIVEAMKSMNEIQTDVSGVIKEICVENAELVEFEQPLFKIERVV